LMGGGAEVRGQVGVGAEVRGQVGARSIYMTSGRAEELFMGVLACGGRWAVSWSRVCMGALLGAGGEM